MTTTPQQHRTVPSERDGERLDRLLVDFLPGRSRTFCQELIRAGAVRLDGVPVDKPGTILRAGQRLDVELRERELRVLDDAHLQLAVVHEDEHLVVIDKPAGMLAHPSAGTRGGSVSELAVRRWGALPSLQGTDRPGVVHRLDAGTSGLMVLARTEAAFEDLMRQFRSRAVAKTYLALVHGEPRFDSDWIEARIERSSTARDRMSVAKEGVGRSASTFYRVLERFRGFALLECQPKTGRTHQIRVHLLSIALPIVGDPLYRHRGPVRIPLPKGSAPERQLLHASGLAFAHPVGRQRVEFESPLPPDFQTVTQAVRNS
jgi:23S rRNA pseudouridine1911/1915/1917 synthase